MTFNPVWWRQEIFINLHNGNILWAHIIYALYKYEDFELPQLDNPVLSQWGLGFNPSWNMLGICPD